MVPSPRPFAIWPVPGPPAPPTKCSQLGGLSPTYEIQYLPTVPPPAKVRTVHRYHTYGISTRRIKSCAICPTVTHFQLNRVYTVLCTVNPLVCIAVFNLMAQVDAYMEFGIRDAYPSTVVRGWPHLLPQPVANDQSNKRSCYASASALCRPLGVV